MKPHNEIIARIGIRKLARLLGHANHTTVQGWHDRSDIPFKHWPDLIQATAGEGEPVTLAELMPKELKDAAA